MNGFGCLFMIWCGLVICCWLNVRCGWCSCVVVIFFIC